jgi:hypothetical protein
VTARAEAGRAPGRLSAIEERELFEVSTSGPDDVVRLEDRRGREHQK